jgi:hypothetical protein
MGDWIAKGLRSSSLPLSLLTTIRSFTSTEFVPSPRNHVCLYGTTNFDDSSKRCGLPQVKGIEPNMTQVLGRLALSLRKFVPFFVCFECLLRFFVVCFFLDDMHRLCKRVARNRSPHVRFIEEWMRWQWCKDFSPLEWRPIPSGWRCRSH